jgi:hypothetical protein
VLVLHTAWPQWHQPWLQWPQLGDWWLRELVLVEEMQPLPRKQLL